MPSGRGDRRGAHYAARLAREGPPISPDSLALHLNAEGELNFERTLLHASLIEGLLGDGPRREHAHVTFMAGGPAAGKSRLREVLGLAGEAAIVIDVDDIREQLPEYAQWISEQPEQAADLTHREASQVSKVALAIALARGRDVVFDTVGGDDEGSFSAKIQGAIDRGATVVVTYATVAVELALEREAERFAKRRRRVPEKVLRAKHAEVSRGIRSVSELAVEHIAVYDTTGEEPLLLAQGPGGAGLDGLEVIHPEGYAAFLEKGN